MLWFVVYPCLIRFAQKTRRGVFMSFLLGGLTLIVAVASFSVGNALGYEEGMKESKEIEQNINQWMEGK